MVGRRPVLLRGTAAPVQPGVAGPLSRRSWSGQLLQPRRGQVEVVQTGRRRRIGRLHLGIHLGPVDLDAARGLDAQPHGIAAHLKHHHPHLISDDDALSGTTSQYQHCGLPPWNRRTNQRNPTRNRVPQPTAARTGQSDPDRMT